MNLKEKVIFEKAFIVDTNILFTFFWENSFTKGILIDQDFEFFSPVYALEEINKYKEEIINKTGISYEKFKELRADLGICVEFIPIEEYENMLLESLKLLPNNNKILIF